VAKARTSTAANVGFEAELWMAADALRGSMDSGEYKHVVLGLLFLKYISDAFEEQHATLQADIADGADLEDRDEYKAVNVFWVPKEARWQTLKAAAKQPEIDRFVDDAMSPSARIDRQHLREPSRAVLEKGDGTGDQPTLRDLVGHHQPHADIGVLLAGGDGGQVELS